MENLCQRKHELCDTMIIKWSPNFSCDGPYTNKTIISLQDDYSKHTLLSNLNHGHYIMAKMTNEHDFTKYEIFHKDLKYIHGWSSKNTFLMIGWWFETKDKICELYTNEIE